MTRISAARAHIWEGDLDLAAIELRLLQMTHATPVLRMSVLAGWAHLELDSGQLTQCAATLTALLDDIEAEPPGALTNEVLGRALQGALSLERADTAEAERTLRRVRESGSHFRVPAIVIANVALSRLWAAEGRHDAALVAIADSYRLIRARPPRSGVLDHIRRQHVRILAATADLDQAAAVLANIGCNPRRQLLDAELAASRGDLERARGQLSDLAATPPATPRQRLELALASLRLDHRAGAQTGDHASAALQIACSEGFLFPLVEAGTEALLAVQAQARRLPRTTAIDALLRLRPPLPPTGRSVPDDANSLTERERAVLRYMATSMSYPEIADDLVVSPNTIKTHVKNINRKLHATSRSDAVRTAQALRYL